MIVVLMKGHATSPGQRANAQGLHRRRHPVQPLMSGTRPRRSSISHEAYMRMFPGPLAANWRRPQ